MPSTMDAAQWVGPLILFLLMTAVGLELSPADFRRVAAAPRAAIGGTVAQILLLPLSTWAVVALLNVPPIFGAGAVLVAVAPGAGISNVLTALARANLALCVTLTALTSVLCVVTLPTIAALGMGMFLGDSVDIDVPVALLMTQLIFSMLLPIGLGMALRARRPLFVARHQRRFQRFTLVTIAALTTLGVAFADTGQLTLADAGVGFVAAGVWTAAAMAIGWAVASALRLPPSDRFTFLIEFSTRNIGVAAIVAISGLGRLDLALFSGVYAAVGYPMAAVAALARRRATAPVALPSLQPPGA
jgi:bile acid:Na+ symporter, BASS family